LAFECRQHLSCSGPAQRVLLFSPCSECSPASMVRLRWLAACSVAVNAYAWSHPLAASDTSHRSQHVALSPLAGADAAEEHARIMRSDSKLSRQAHIDVLGEMTLPAGLFQKMNYIVGGQQNPFTSTSPSVSPSPSPSDVASDAPVDDGNPMTASASTTPASTTDVNMDFYGHCQWKDDDIDTFASKILAVSLCSNLVGLSMIAVISLPLFGGKFADKLIVKVPGDEEKAGNLYALASLVGIAGALTGLMPMVGVSSACANVGTDICAGCKASAHPCTDKESLRILRTCKELGIVGVYSVGFGWIAILTGAVTAGLSLCACCRCFRLDPRSTYQIRLADEAAQSAGTPIAGEAAQSAGSGAQSAGSGSEAQQAGPQKKEAQQTGPQKKEGKRGFFGGGRRPRPRAAEDSTDEAY